VSLSAIARDRLAMGGLLGLGLFLHRRALFGNAVMYKRDVHLVWVPQVEAFVRAVFSGAWPVWDPGPGFGQPLLADTSAQVLYPLTWLNLLMRPWAYYTLYSLFHSVLSALGTFRLARHFGASSAGGFVAGAVWIASGPFLSLVDLWHHYAGAAWIPWVFLTALRALEVPGPRRVGVAGLVVALQILAGSADLCAMTLLSVGLYAAVFMLDWRKPFAPANVRRTVGGVSALALALGVSAALWMTALDLVLRTPRMGLPEPVRTYWSVHPLGALQMLFPKLWTNIPMAPSLRETLLEGREPFLFSLYLGLPCLALIAGGLARQPGALKTFWLALGAGAALLALGRHFVVYDIVVFLLPPLRILRYPVKVLVLVAFAWALLAGLGFDAWRQAGVPDRRRWALRVLLPLLLVSLVGLSGALFLRHDPETWGPRVAARGDDGPPYRSLVASATIPLLTGFGLAAASAAIAVARARTPSSGTWAAVLAVFAVGDLALFHRNAIPLAPRDLYLHRPPVVDALREAGAVRLYVYDYTQRRPDLSWMKSGHGDDLASVPVGWDLDQASALGQQQTLAPATAGRWGFRSGFEIDYRGLQTTVLTRLTTVVREFGAEAQLRLLRVGAVTHAVALHGQGFEDLVPFRTWETLLVEPLRVFRVPEPLPRARAVGGARIAGEVEELEALLDPGFDPSREVLLPAGEASPPASEVPGAVRIVEERSDRVALEADLRVPAFVVLADSFDPGWRATLDGTPVPVLRANLVFRAIRVPAGRHRIEMVYRPRALVVGLAVSAVAVLFALMLLAWGPRP
jgi:Bacterial membrane protein YfhO